MPVVCKMYGENVPNVRGALSLCFCWEEEQLPPLRSQVSMKALSPLMERCHSAFAGSMNNFLPFVHRSA